MLNILAVDLLGKDRILNIAGGLACGIQLALPVLDRDVGAASLDLARAVSDLLSVGVIGRQVVPGLLVVVHVKAAGVEGLGGVLAGHVGPVAVANLLLELEGALHDRQGVEVHPGFEDRKARRGAVDVVGGSAVLHGPRRVGGQPLAGLDAAGKARIPVVLRRAGDGALTVVCEREAHVDGLSVVEHLLIEGIVARAGHMLLDGVGIGARRHVGERDGDGEVARADAVLIGSGMRVGGAVGQRDRGRGLVVISAKLHAFTRCGHRRVRILRREGKAVLGLRVIPLAPGELLGNRDRHGAVGVVVVVEDLIAVVAACVVGDAVHGLGGGGGLAHRMHGADDFGDLLIGRVLGNVQERVDHAVIRHGRGQLSVAVVLNVDLNELVGGVVEDAVLLPDVEAARGIGHVLAKRGNARGLLVGHADPCGAVAQLLVVPGIGHGTLGDGLGYAVVEVVDVVLVGVKLGTRILKRLNVEVDRVEVLGAAAVGGARAVGVDGHHVGGEGPAYGGTGLAHGLRALIDLRFGVGHRRDAVLRGNDAPLLGGCACRGVFHDLVARAANLGNPDLVDRAVDGHVLLRHGLLGKRFVHGAAMLHDLEVAVGLRDRLNLDRLDGHGVGIVVAPRATLAVCAGEGLSGRDRGRAIGGIERGVGDDNTVDVVGLVLSKAAGKVDRSCVTGIVERVVLFARHDMKAQVGHGVGVAALLSATGVVGRVRVVEAVFAKVDRFVLIGIFLSSRAGKDIVGLIRVIAGPQVDRGVNIRAFLAATGVVDRLPHIVRAHVGLDVVAARVLDVVRRVGSGRRLIALDLAFAILRAVLRIGIDEVAVPVRFFRCAKLEDDVGVVLARVDAALRQVREDVREVIFRIRTAKDVGSHDFPCAGGGGGRHPALLEVLRRERPNEGAIRVIVGQHERLGRGIAQKHHGDVVRGLAHPLLPDRDVGEGGVRELGRHGGLCHRFMHRTAQHRLRLGAGGVVVVGNLRLELALKVVGQRDLGIDQGGVVGQAALDLHFCRRALLVDDVDKAAGNAGLGVGGHGRARQVGKLVANGREVGRVVGYLRVGVELALEGACLVFAVLVLRFDHAVAIEVARAAIGGSHESIVRILAKLPGGAIDQTHGKAVDRILIARGILADARDVEVGRAGLETGCLCRRQVHGLVVVAGWALLGLVAIQRLANLSRDGDALGVVRARGNAGIVGRVANRHHREAEGRRIGEQALVVPLGAADRPPVGALEQLGCRDRALARGVVGVGEALAGGANGLPCAGRVGVLDGRDDAAIAVVLGVDVHLEDGRAVGDALIGIDIARGLARSGRIGPRDVGGHHGVKLAEGVVGGFFTLNGALRDGCGALGREVGHATIGVGTGHVAFFDACGQRCQPSKVCRRVKLARQLVVVVGERGHACAVHHGRGAVVSVGVGVGRRGFAARVRLRDAHLGEVSIAQGLKLRIGEGLLRRLHLTVVDDRGGTGSIGARAEAVDVRIFERARARAGDALGQHGIHGVELCLRVVGHRAVDVGAGACALAIARDAHGQLVVFERVELRDAVARDGLRGIAHVVAVVVLDELLEGVVVIRDPLAALLIQMQVVLRHLDVVEVDEALGLVERGARGLCHGRRDHSARDRRRRHRDGTDRVRRGRHAVLRARRRQADRELILFFVRLARGILLEPAAALEVLDRADLNRAVGFVVGVVGGNEHRPVGRERIARQLVDHGVGLRRGPAVLGRDQLARAVAHEADLEHAVVPTIAVLVIERVLAKVADELGAARALRDRDHGAVDLLPARLQRLFLGHRGQHVIVGLVDRAIQLELDFVGRLGIGFAVHPLLLDHERVVGGVDVLALGDVAVVGRGGIERRGVPCGVDAAFVHRRRELDLEVERAVALVHDLDKRVVGGGVVGKLLRVVEARAHGDDLGAAVDEGAVLVARRDRDRLAGFVLERVGEAVRAGRDLCEVVHCELVRGKVGVARLGAFAGFGQRRGSVVGHDRVGRGARGNDRVGKGLLLCCVALGGFHQLLKLLEGLLRAVHPDDGVAVELKLDVEGRAVNGLLHEEEGAEGGVAVGGLGRVAFGHGVVVRRPEVGVIGAKQGLLDLRLADVLGVVFVHEDRRVGANLVLGVPVVGNRRKQLAQAVALDMDMDAVGVG